MATIEMSKMKVGSNVVEIVDQKARDGITQLNADKDELQHVKANAIKSTYAGETIVATDSSDAKFEGLRVFGKSTQPSTTGKNLLNNKNTTETINGVTFTVNKDKSVTVNGTATGSNAEFSFVYDANIDGDCILSGCPNGGSLSSYYINVLDTTTWGSPAKDFGSGATLSLIEGRRYHVRILIVKDKTVSNLTFYPMIRLASITDGTYEPYSGGVASPSPDWAQPIESVGDDGQIDVGVYGWNFVNSKKIVKNRNESVNVSDDGYTITVIGGTTTNWSDSYIDIVEFPKLKGKKLYVSIDSVSATNVKATKVSFIVVSTTGKTNYSLQDGKKEVVIPYDVKDVYVSISTNYSEDPLSSQNEVVVKGLKVSLSDIPYETYKQPQSLVISTSSGLPAIEVTDPSLATYTDSEGKMWCSDEVDFARGKYVQRIKTESIKVDRCSEYGSTDKYIRIITRRFDDCIESSSVMCNFFKNNGRNPNSISIDAGINRLSIFFDKGPFPTFEDAIDFIKNNEVVVMGILATPIELDLTSAEIAAYKALHTNYSSTVIMNDCNAFTEVTMVADTFNYVNDHYGESVLYGEQHLSNEQKQQARMNIDSANSIKKTYSGEMIVSTESAHSWFEGLKVFGRSEQVSTTGKNLLEITESSATINGATFTINDDGSVTVNGTATSTCYFAYSRMDLDVTKKYILSGTTVKSNNNYVYIDNVSPRIADNGDGSITYVENVTRIHVNIRIDPGTYNNLLFKPMIRLATIEDDTYEPYSGGFTSPSPDWVQPIESVGDDGSIDVGVYGKNLFDVEEFVRLVKNLGGYEQTVDNRRCIVFFNSDLYKKDFSSVFSNFKKNTQYTLSLSAKPMNASSVDKALIVGIFKDNEDSLSSNIARYTQMTFANIGVTTFVNKSVTLPVGSTGKSIGFSYIDYTLWAIDLDSIQLEESPVQTEIDNTPKQSLSIPTPNGLPGIPLGATIPDAIVSSEKHMRGVWWCEEEQQYYIGDTKEYGRGKNVQRIKTETFDGVTNKMQNADTNFSERYGFNYAWVQMKDKLIGGACMANIGMISNSDVVCKEGWTSSTINDSMSISFSDERTGITSSDNKATITDKINKVLEEIHVKIQYVLAEPIETDLPSSEIEAFKALHSNYPTTTILNDCNAFTEVTMVADTKNHIEQNYVPKSEFESVLDRLSAVEQALA